MVVIIPQYTVSELVNSIKTVLEGAFYYIRVIGEISGLKLSSSGHVYFNLKDGGAIINVVLFRNYYNTKVVLENGFNVEIYGKLTIYKDRSNYQIIAEKIEINGEGELLRIINERKKKLENEGLFDRKYKKEIPKKIKKLGIITSASGAAIRDIEVRLINRLVLCDIILYPSLVQGNEAEKGIIKGIKYFNVRERVDVIVITRGGGSIEDLMCFNGELLSREIFNSKIPIITAIGHEIDWTIVDYVSDLRLPTPTAVAEFLFPSKNSLNEKIDYLFKKIIKITYKIYKNIENRITDIVKKIRKKIGDNFNSKVLRIKLAMLRLNSFNRNKILKLGYAIVIKNNNIIGPNTLLNIGDNLEIKMYKRKITVKVTKIN
jgi:exodeoxyribonuclease VII large subunit